MPKALPARILSVTEDPLLGETRRALMKSFGFEVIASDSTPDALELIQAHSFEILILGHSLNSQQCCVLAAAYRQKCPQGRVIEIVRFPDTKPVTDPDSTIVGLAGPDVLLATIRMQLRMTGSD